MPVYRSLIDGDQKYGECNGFIRKSLVGASFNDSTGTGSRSIVCHVAPSYYDDMDAARGCIYAILCLQNLG